MRTLVKNFLVMALLVPAVTLAGTPAVAPGTCDAVVAGATTPPPKAEAVKDLEVLLSYVTIEIMNGMWGSAPQKDIFFKKGDADHANLIVNTTPQEKKDRIAEILVENIRARVKS